MTTATAVTTTRATRRSKVRTPAGASHNFDVKPNERVDKVIRKAVEYFVAAGQLAAGNYGLSVERNGQLIPLNEAGRLEDFDVAECDVLFLTIKDPQVDGSCCTLPS